MLPASSIMLTVACVLSHPTLFSEGISDFHNQALFVCQSPKEATFLAASSKQVVRVQYRCPYHMLSYSNIFGKNMCFPN